MNARQVCSLACWLVLSASALASDSSAQSSGIPLSQLPCGLHSLMPVPANNPLTDEKIELGRRLFFEKRLSRDGTISCAPCHQPDKAFTDGRAVPVGVEGRIGRRNVPSLLNCAYGKSLFWDGRAASLEEQALQPITRSNEMGNSLESALAALSTDSSYRALFRKAFGGEEATTSHLAQALASYERTLVSGDSAYDRFTSIGDATALSEAAQRGLALFRGKARCAFCHEGSRFTDEKFHNTGVSWGKEPLDLGRFELTGKEEDRGRFKTASLRNLPLTAPYMHDGSLATIEEVVEFYNLGGGTNAYLDPAIRPIELSNQEKRDLIAFLKELTSPSNSRFIRPIPDSPRDPDGQPDKRLVAREVKTAANGKILSLSLDARLDKQMNLSYTDKKLWPAAR